MGGHPDSSQVTRAIAKARAYAKVDPELSLTLARKAAERLCLYLLATGGDAAGAHEKLDALIAQVRSKDLVPEAMVAPLRIIQAYGNFAVHAQPEEAEAGITPRYAEPCLSALSQLTEWFYGSFLRVPLPLEVEKPEAAGVERLGPAGLETHVFSIEDLTLGRWDMKTALAQWMALDSETMLHLRDETEGRPEQWMPVVLKHPDTWRLLVDLEKRRVVGYWHFVPLFEPEFQKARAGQLFDLEITADNIPYFELPGRYKIYFVGMVILPAYRGVGAFGTMLDALLSRLTALAERGVFIEELCTNAWTPDGLSLCKTMQMTHLGRHVERGEIHAMPLLPIPETAVFRRHARLMELYRAEDARGAPSS